MDRSQEPYLAELRRRPSLDANLCDTGPHVLVRSLSRPVCCIFAIRAHGIWNSSCCSPASSRPSLRHERSATRHCRMGSTSGVSWSQRLRLEVYDYSHPCNLLDHRIGRHHRKARATWPGGQQGRHAEEAGMGLHACWSEAVEEGTSGSTSLAKVIAHSATVLCNKGLI